MNSAALVILPGSLEPALATMLELLASPPEISFDYLVPTGGSSELIFLEKIPLLVEGSALTPDAEAGDRPEFPTAASTREIFQLRGLAPSLAVEEPIVFVSASPEKIVEPPRLGSNPIITTDPKDFEVLPLNQTANFPAGRNAAFDLIGLTALRNDTRFAGLDGSGLSVAVIDTGINATHPALVSNFRAFVDFLGSNNPSLVTNANLAFDTVGHGTHVSGTIGSTNPEIGIAPQVDLLGLQVFSSGGTANLFTVERALQWVLDNREEHNIVAVNLSLGGGLFASDSDPALRFNPLVDEVERLEAAGVTIVAAAGNSFASNSTPGLAAPAIFSTLAVGAVYEDGSRSNVQFGGGARDFTTGTDRIASFSQRLDAPNFLFAPGAFINSTASGGGFAEQAGTSMAAPHVTGAVALLQEAALEFGGRFLSTTEISDILLTTGDRIFDGDDENDNVINTNTSFTRLNVFNAVEAVYDLFAQPEVDPLTGVEQIGNLLFAGSGREVF
ncbi:MAG: S8 family serine peptidase [Chloroflexaceae bacterium]|nr:S8 family serine peptidase [Chloroflexaceae bacterium]